MNPTPDEEIANVWTAQRWRNNLALATAACSVLAAAVAISTARAALKQQECREKEPEQYYFDRDGRDLAPPSRWPSTVPIEDPTAILHAVEDTVEKARAWSFDAVVNEEKLAWAYAHLPQESDARKKFQEWTAALQSGQYTSVRYKHVATIPKGAFTFIVVWQEMRQPEKGKPVEVQLRGEFEVRIWPLSAIITSWRKLNHTGVFLQNANIVEEYSKELQPPKELGK